MRKTGTVERFTLVRYESLVFKERLADMFFRVASLKTERR